MEESDFRGRGHSSIIVYFGNSSDLTWIVESNKRFPFKKYSAITGYLNLAKRSPEGFSSCVFNRLCATHSKSNKNKNEESKNQRVSADIFFF